MLMADIELSPPKLRNRQSHPATQLYSTVRGHDQELLAIYAFNVQELALFRDRGYQA